jgi:hypothetical protein
MSEPADRPDEAMNRAVEAAHKALADTPGLPSNGDVSKLSKPHVELPRPIIEAAAPVLIEAERERIGAGIRSLRLNAPAWPKDDSYEAGLEAALSVIDKEGGEA